MASVPHLLYMFEFAIDDLVISRMNPCSPVEFPTCVELTFRNSVYVSICDNLQCGLADEKPPMIGKSCVFALNAPVKAEDRLLIHVYKKRSERCKFMIGMTDVKVKHLFDQVDESFNLENRNWRDERQKNFNEIPTFKSTHRKEDDEPECLHDVVEPMEQLYPSHVLFKQLLPLFNTCKQQTGNMVLIMRLVCHGPTIVSAFFKEGLKFQTATLARKQDYRYTPPSKEESNHPSKGYRFFASNDDKLCPYDICEDWRTPRQPVTYACCCPMKIGDCQDNDCTKHGKKKRKKAEQV